MLLAPPVSYSGVYISGTYNREYIVYNNYPQVYFELTNNIANPGWLNQQIYTCAEFKQPPELIYTDIQRINNISNLSGDLHLSIVARGYDSPDACATALLTLNGRAPIATGDSNNTYHIAFIVRHTGIFWWDPTHVYSGNETGYFALTVLKDKAPKDIIPGTFVIPVESNLVRPERLTSSPPFTINSPILTDYKGIVRDYRGDVLPTSLSVKSGPATISGTPGGTYTVKLRGTTGEVVIAVDQSEDSYHQPFIQATSGFYVVASFSKLSQAISSDQMPTITSKTPGAAPFTIHAPTSTSGLPVTLSVKSGPATISGTPGGTYTVTLNGTAGTVIIAANQSGNSSYNAATEIITSFSVAYLSQTVVLFPILRQWASSPPFTIDMWYSSSGGLPITLSVKSGPATISGTPGGTYTVTLNGTAGTVIIAANQSGNRNYSAAPEVTTSFNVLYLWQEISPIIAIGEKAPGAAPFTVTAPTSTSGLPVTLSVKSGPATISGTPGGTYTVTLKGTAGTVIIAANQSGNSTYEAAYEVTTSFSASYLSQRILAFYINNKAPNAQPFTVAAPTSTSGLPVTLSVKSGPATISGTPGGTYTVTLNGTVGTVIIAANQPGDINYTAAAEVTEKFFVELLSQRISAFSAITSKTPGAAPFTIDAPTSTSGLPVTLSIVDGPATISGTPGGTYTVTLNGTAGTVFIDATQIGDSIYMAHGVQTSFEVAYLSQTISAISAITSKTPDAAPFTVAAPISTSGLPVTLSVKSGPATISGTPGGAYTVTLNGTIGTVVIAANQSGNSSYNAATEVTARFGVAYLSQTISAFSTITSKTPNTQPFTVTAPTSTSGLPVTLSIQDGPATISGTPGGAYTVTLNGTTGIVIIAANQSGNSSYNAATEVTARFGVAYLSQTISEFSTITSKTPTTQPFTVTAPTSTSGLPVVLFIVSGPATISGTPGGAYTVTLDGTIGTVIIVANQIGDSSYNTANQVTTSFDVAYLSQTISAISAISGRTPYAAPFSVSAPTSSSSLPVSLSILSGPASITGTAGGMYTVTLSGTAGTVNVAANQSGNSNYSPAAQVTTSFDVAYLSQTISAISAISGRTPDAAPFSVSAPTSSSSLPVSLSILSGPASITGTAGGMYTVTLSGTAGTVNVAANQSGNSNYSPAAQVTTSFDVAYLSQTISAISAISDKMPDAAPFTVSAPTSTSELPVTLTVKSGPATISGTPGDLYTVTLNGTAGTVVLAANQSGDSNYNAAAEVTQSFAVQKLTQYVSQFSLSNVSTNTPHVYLNAPSSSSLLPVGLSILDGPATISGTPGGMYTVTLNGDQGRVVVAANQTGNIAYFAAQTFTTDFYVIEKDYNINIPVNKFFYTGLLLAPTTGTIIASGLPSGLSFNRNNNYIVGAPNFTGIFNSYIFESGGSGYTGLNFTINPPDNTGYPYALGPGLGYGENSIPLDPLDFSSTAVGQVLAGNGFSIAVADQYVYVPPAGPPVSALAPVVPQCSAYFPYVFTLSNRSSEDCINDFTMTSTVTGNCSGYLDNSLSFGYMGGTAGTTSMGSIVTSGYQLKIY